MGRIWNSLGKNEYLSKSQEGDLKKKGEDMQKKKRKEENEVETAGGKMQMEAPKNARKRRKTTFGGFPRLQSGQKEKGIHGLDENPVTLSQAREKYPRKGRMDLDPF